MALDGVLMKCNRDAAKARTDSDCLNARIAIERLASKVDPAEQQKHAEEFEKNREQLRAAQDKARQEQEASKGAPRAPTSYVTCATSSARVTISW